MMRGQLKEALWVATAAHEGNINPPVVSKRSSESLINGIVDKDYDSQGYVHRNRVDMSDSESDISGPFIILDHSIF